MQEYKYKAFISYRHIPFDSIISERVLKLIETYIPPRSLRGNGKFKQWRCFRDKEELPLSNNLSDEIYEALRNSEFFIIICSSEYNDSLWCLAELDYFKKIHKGRTDNIAVISIKGDPRETFPEQVKSSIENGKLRVVEPLSADIRADNEKKSLKKLDKLYLKMIALFLNCGYDDLIHRQENRERKKIISILAIVISVLLAFITVLSLSYNKVQEKNKKIETQNYNLRIDNAELLALESEILWKESHPIEAIQTVLRAMPSEDNPIPLLPSVSYNLANQIGAFKPTNFKPVKTITLHDCPNKLLFSDDGNTLITSDDTYISFYDTANGKMLRQYNLSNLNNVNGSVDLYQLPRKMNMEISEKGGPGEKSLSSGEYFFENCKISETYDFQKRPIYYYTRPYFYNNSDNYNTIYCFDESDGDIIWKKENIYQKPVYREDNVILVTGSSAGTDYNIEVCDAMSGELLKNFNAKSLSVYDNWYIVDYDDKTKNFLINVRMENQCYAVTASVKSGELSDITEQYSLPYGELCSSSKDNGIVYSVSTDFVYGDMGTVNYIVRAFDLVNKKSIWEQTISGQGYTGKTGVIKKDTINSDSDCVFFINSDKMTLMQADNGKIIHQYIFSGNIIDYRESLNGIIIVTIADGEEIAIEINRLFYSESEPTPQPVCYLLHNYLTDVSCCSRANDKYFVSSSTDNKVYIYQDVENPDYTELLKPDSERDESSIYISAIDVQQQNVKYIARYSDYKYMKKMLSLKTGEITDLGETDHFDYISENIKIPEWFNSDEFSGLDEYDIIILNDTEVAVIFDYEIRIYDYATGEILHTSDIPYNNEIIKQGFSLDNGKSILLVGNKGGVYKISSETGKVEATTKITIPDTTNWFFDYGIRQLSKQIVVIFHKNRKKYAWVLDSQNLDAKYYIEDFEYYDEDNGNIYLFDPYSCRLGVIPEYTTDDLTRKAEEYLTGE